MRRKIRSMQNNRGFTLAEMIIVVIILGIVMSAISTFFRLGYVMTDKGTDQYDTQSQTRIAVSQIVKEIRYSTELSIITAETAISEKSGSTYSYVYFYDSKIYMSLYDSLTGIRTDKELAGTYVASGTHFAKVSDQSQGVEVSLTSEVDDQSFTADAQIILRNLDLVSPTASVGGMTISTAMKFK